MKLTPLPIVLAALLPVPLAAEIRPEPGPGDPRIQSVLYDPDQVVQLQVATGYQLSVEFSPDERIENVAVGDSGAWLVTPNKRGDRLFIKAVQSGVSTNLTVVTDARSYSFELQPLYGPLPTMAYSVRFRYPAPAVATIADKAAAETGRYKLGGAMALRPSAIDDDGSKTYIIWEKDQTLPAVFAIDSHGKEVLVDGVIRDGRYVIDSVANRLLFRLDKQDAEAIRVPARKLR